MPAPPADEVRALQAASWRGARSSPPGSRATPGLLDDVAGELEAVRGRVATWRWATRAWASVAAGRGAHPRRAAARRCARRCAATAGRGLARVAQAGEGPLVPGPDPRADHRPADGGAGRRRPTSSATCSATTTTSRCCSAPAEGRPGLQASIVARRDALRRVAATLGRRIYGERPKAFARRLEALLAAHEDAARGVGAVARRRRRAQRARELLAAKPAADPAGRRQIAAGLRRLGLRSSDYESQTPAAARRLRGRGPRAARGARDRARGRAARSRDARRPLEPRCGSPYSRRKPSLSVTWK